MKIAICFLFLFVGIISPRNSGATSIAVSTSGEALPGKLPGGDDDPPIIIEKTKRGDFLPVVHSLVVFYNNVHTIRAYTDNNGEATVTLPEYGTWKIRITHDDYETVESEMEITLPVSTRTDILKIK